MKAVLFAWVVVLMSGWTAIAAPADAIDTGGSFIPRGFRFEGNTVVATDTLDAIARPFVGRRATIDDLMELAHLLTRHYVGLGYVNSGALLPDQEVEDGVVTFRVVEGSLGEVAVNGTQGLDPDYVRRRLTHGLEPVLDVNALQERFQILLQDPLIRQLNGALGPGRTPGESRLDLDVTRARPYDLTVVADNHSAPSLGAVRGRVEGVVRNLTGMGDAVELSVGRAGSLTELSGGVSVPVSAADTRVGVRADRNRSRVIEAPLDELDVSSRSHGVAAFVSQPVHRTAFETLTVEAKAEQRHSETRLLSQPYSFSPGVEDGRATVNALRLVADWLDRREETVLALRSTVSVGVAGAGATVHGEEPDSQFASALGQAQWVRRFGERGPQLVLRGDAQWSADRLLTLEQFALGGADSVRGYRESQFLRDNALVGSVEWRQPVAWLPLPGLSDGPLDGRLDLAPFADFGLGWDHGRWTARERLASVGIGLRWSVAQAVHAEVYWGHALTEVPEPTERGLQDRGIHFGISLGL